MGLDFFTRETAHHKIYIDFVNRLSNGEYGKGERLPSCVAVAENYNVSKGTAHKAYQTLERNGFITTTSRGSFVADLSGISPHTSLAELLSDTIERAKDSGISDRDITGAIEVIMEKYC